MRKDKLRRKKLASYQAADDAVIMLEESQALDTPLEQPEAPTYKSWEKPEAPLEQPEPPPPPPPEAPAPETKIHTDCPKCGGRLTHLRVRYCNGAAACQHERDGMPEHLFSRCECGFETNIRPCLDAEKK